jgi:Mn2+/Fe2+ NRAMP family transporter
VVGVTSCRAAVDQQRKLMGDYVNSRLGNLMTYTIAIIVSLLSVTLILGTVLDWFGVKLLGG